YDGIQHDFQYVSTPLYEISVNAKMKGGELDMQSLLARGLTLNFAGAYIDAYYNFVDPAIGIPQYYDLNRGLVLLPPLSARLPKTPKYKLTLGPTYDFGLSNQG